MSEFEKQPDSERPADPLDQLLNAAEWPEPDAEADDRLLRHWSSLQFDQLLGEADWPDPDADAVNRLHRHWWSLRVTKGTGVSQTRFLVRVAAVAAVIVLAVGSWWLLRTDPAPGLPVAPVVPHPGPAQIADDADTGNRTTPDPDTGDVADDEVVIAESTNSRPATPYELLLVRSVERRSQEPPVEAEPVVESPIEQFVANPDADTAAFVASLDVDRAAFEQELLEMIENVPAEQQSRIIHVLEYVASSASILPLIELSRSEETRRDAVRALTLLADVEVIAGLASSEFDEESRQQYLAELLSRQNEEALTAYLDLLMDRPTRNSALAVLDEETMPPVRLLFGFMRGPNYSRRMAAAIVLGRLDQPDVTEQLIRLTRSQFNRQEAFVGLLVSPDERAGRFLSIAHQDQTMIAAVTSAQLQLHHLSQ